MPLCRMLTMIPTQETGETMTTTAETDHLLLLAQLPRWERVALAARCARVAVRLLDSLSLPVGLKQMAALEEVLRLAEESAARARYIFELQPAMEKLKHLAFDAETECKYRSDSIICQAVRATHAAGMAAFAGSSIDAQDALRAAFAAARTAESSAAAASRPYACSVASSCG